MSDSSRFHHLENLFREASALGEASRATFLEGIEDPEVRHELDRLLQHTAGTEVFLDQSPLQRGAPSSPVGTVTPGDRIGDFTITEVLAAGGMATVFRAEQDRPRRDVALKVLRAGFSSEDSRRRFELEAEILGTLSHPGIAQIFGAGVHDGVDGEVPWLAMEFVEGRDLLSHAEAAQLDLPARCDLLARVGDAVEHAHQKGVIHRDLKPSNILVTPTGQPKVLDFGVARVTRPDLRATQGTTAGHIVGTLRYMSPEQVRGDPAATDTRSDVYALGVLLYRLVGGAHPLALDDISIPEAARVICETSPAPLPRSCRGDVETIARKALEKEPDRRYGTATALAADLRRHLAHEPIEARPASLSYRLGRFALRHKALTALVIAVVLALAGGIVATSIARTRAESEATKARTAAREAATLLAFFRDSLSAVDPVTTGQRRLLLREYLDDVAGGLASLSDQPESLIFLHATLGDAYAAIGRSAEARHHLGRSVDLRRAHFGSDHPRTAEGLRSLGHRLHRLGIDPEAARVALEQAIAIYATRNDPPVADWIRAEADLAAFHLTAVDVAAASTHIRRALDLAARAPELPPQDEMQLRWREALVLTAQGRAEQAFNLLDDLVLTTQSRLGADHPLCAAILMSRGEAAHHLDRQDEAERCARQSLDLLRQRFGDQPVLLQSSHSLLGRVHLARHEAPEAVAFFRDLLRQQDEVGVAEITRAETHTWLARGLSGLDPAECIEHLDAADAIYTRYFPTGHPRQATILQSRAILAANANHLEEAERHATAAVTLKSRFPLMRSDVQLLTTRATLLGLLNRFPEAIEAHDEAIALATRVLGPSAEITLLSRLARANDLAISGDRERARAAHSETFALIDADPSRFTTSARLVIAQSRLAHALCLIEASAHEAAEPILIRTLDDLLAHAGPEAPLTLEAARRLAAVYRELDMPERLQALREKLSAARE